MARYEHLPIYKTAIDTAVYLQQIVRNFSRYDKYTIGTDLRNLSREILLLIIRANSVQDKTAVLKVLVENCEMLKTMIPGAGHSAALVEESGIHGSICERYVQSVYLL